MSLEALYRGEAKWTWVVRQDPDGWLVCDWNGEEYWIAAREYEAKPDLERLLNGQRVPVIRRIGSGKMAQHFRFERKDAA